MGALAERLAKKPQRVFLLDGLGALLTAFMHGFVLIKFHDQVGMPPAVLYALSVIALVFAIYSLTCAKIAKDNWRLLLRIVVVANLVFGALSIAMVFIFFHDLHLLGFVYFGLEIIVLGLIANFEYTVAGS